MFTYLARLSPGVVPAEPGARDAQSGGFSANGVRSTGENNFLLNGVDNNVNVIDFINQTSFIIGPSVEAIGDMQVITNGASAEYGRAAGGVLDITLKSGTNQLHGTLFEIFQNTVLDANRWENNLAGVPRNTVQAEPVWSGYWRPDHQEQAVYVRRLSGHPDLDGRRHHSEPRLWRVLHDSDAGDGGRGLFESAWELDWKCQRAERTAERAFQSKQHSCLSGCVPGTLTALAGATPNYTRAPFAGIKYRPPRWIRPP